MKNNNTIYNDILEHFETRDDVLVIQQSYDMRALGAMDQLEYDSAAAWRAVRDLSLNYNIEAKHEAYRTDFDDEVSTVRVEWKFWK